MPFHLVLAVLFLQSWRFTQLSFINIVIASNAWGVYSRIPAEFQGHNT
ncbi:MAG: hypothetical protein K0U68_04755 [Gammaproteobacteria bacterium]|nr:hypothetical protein [Gammaproteobacteria bacterium]